MSAPANRWLVLVAMTGSLSMIMLDQTVVTVALPAMSDDLGLHPAGQQWVVNAYVLALTALVAFGGKLGDRVGGVRTFRIGVAGFFIASALCGLAPVGALGEAWIIAARALQGAAAALMILTGFGLGLTISPTHTDALSRVGAADRSQASGVLQTVRQLGGTLGVAVVGAVVLGIEHRGTRGPDPQAAADAIAAGFAVSTAAFAVALLVAIRLRARDRVAADPAAASEGVA